MHKTLSVQLHTGFSALEQFAAQIDALNLMSDRPSPYQSASYMRCFAQYNEYLPEPNAIRLYTVWEDGALIGCLPLRLVSDRFGPLKASRLCFLVPYDIDQPGLSCSPENEKRVARCLIRHICENEANVGMIEFVGQPPGGALYKAAHEAANFRFRTRDIWVGPFFEITLGWENLQTYFRSLSSQWRGSVARSARKLFGAGKPELVFAEGAQATGAWLDAYLDLERRSWKNGTAAAIARHPRRMELYRQLVNGCAGFTPSFIGVLIDGVLVAAALNGSGPTDAADESRGVWNFDLTYDASYADLGPGKFLPLLMVHAAMRRGENFVNLLHSFGHYKQHWKAAAVEVRNVQLIRIWSLHNLRGAIGDLIRSLRSRLRSNKGPSGEQPQDQNNSDSPKGSTIRPDPSQAHAVTAKALAYAGPGICRLDYSQIGELLPFETRSHGQAALV